MIWCLLYFYFFYFVLFNTGTGLQKYVDDLSNCIGSSERIVQTPGKYLISLFNFVICCALLHCATVVDYFLLFWSTLLSALLWSPLFCSVLPFLFYFNSPLFCTNLFCFVLTLFCSVLFCSVLFCSVIPWSSLLSFLSLCCDKDCCDISMVSNNPLWADCRRPF